MLFECSLKGNDHFVMFKLVSEYFKILVTHLDVKFMVPKKYHLNIINDSVEFQKELLKSKLLFIYGMLHG